MSKHTPAPWFVRETGDHYSKRNDIYVIGNPDGSLGGDRKLAMLIDTWAEEQTIHNARLFAAAPELLEALQSVHKIIIEGSLEGFNPLIGNWAKRLYESQYNTSNAIKKATGE